MLFSIQINRLLAVAQFNHKPTHEETYKGEIVDPYQKFNQVNYWHLYENADTDLVIKAINKGYSIRYGIKRQSNRIEDFEYADGTAIDLDCDNSDMLDLYRVNQLVSHSFYLHPSPSFDGQDKFNSRVHFKFNRRVTDIKEAKIINYTLMKIFDPDANLEGLDKSCNDPARLWFGCDPNHLSKFPNEFIENKEAVLDVDWILSEASDEIRQHVERSQHKEISYTDEPQNLNQVFCQHLDKILVTKNPEPFISHLKQFLGEHHGNVQNWHEHGSPSSDSVWQYRAGDPLDPHASATSDSFSFSLLEDGCFIWNSPKMGGSGDLATLIYTMWMGLEEYPSYVEGKNKQAAVRYFLTYLDLDPLPEDDTEKKSSTGKKLKTDKKSKDKLSKDEAIAASDKLGLPGFFITEDDKIGFNAKQFLLYNIGNTSHIHYCPSVKLFYIYYELESHPEAHYYYKRDIDLIIHEIINRYHDVFPEFFYPSDVNKNHSYDTDNLFNPHRKSLIKSELTNPKIIPWLDRPLENDLTHVPFLNGLFNLATKKLEPYDPLIKNTFVQPYFYPENYQPTGEGIAMLKELLIEIIDISEDMKEKLIDEDIIPWIACCAQYRAYETKVALGLVGEPGAGKSWLTNLIKDMMIDFSKNEFINDNEDFCFRQFKLHKNLKASTFLDSSNRFSTSKIVGNCLGVLTEFNGIPKGSDGGLLKDLIADPNSYGADIDVEFKGCESFDSTIKAGFITNSQEFPRLPVNDHGWNRRFIWCTFKRSEKNIRDLFDRLDPASRHSDSKTNFLSLFLELIHTDIKPHIERFRYNFQSAAQDHLRQNFQKSNNYFYQYVSETIKPLEDGQVSFSSLYEQFKEWKMDAGVLSNVRKAQFMKDIATVIKDLYPESKLSTVKLGSDLYLSGITYKKDGDYSGRELPPEQAVSEFVQSQIRLGNNRYVIGKELFEAFTVWMENNHIVTPIASSVSFGIHLKDVFDESFVGEKTYEDLKIRPKNIPTLTGISLLSNDEDEPEDNS